MRARANVRVLCVVVVAVAMGACGSKRVAGLGKQCSDAAPCASAYACAPADADGLRFCVDRECRGGANNGCVAGQVCELGQCLYVCVSADGDCPDQSFSCVEGFCRKVGSECATHAQCQAATPPTCYGAAGAWCEAGACHFQLAPAGTFCDPKDACSTSGKCNTGGTCVADSGILCDNPPEPLCSPNSVLVYDARGTCENGTCTYASGSFACDICPTCLGGCMLDINADGAAESVAGGAFDVHDGCRSCDPATSLAHWTPVSCAQDTPVNPCRKLGGHCDASALGATCQGQACCQFDPVWPVAAVSDPAPQCPLPGEDDGNGVRDVGSGEVWSGLCTHAGECGSSDLVAPSGGSVASPSGYQTSTTITVTVSAGFDATSGMSAVANDYRLEVASATLSAGACGTFGAYADAGVAETAAATSYPYTGASGNCYEFRYSVKDAAGNATTYTAASITKVDSEGPSGGSVANTNGTQTSASITVTLSAGTDAAAGMSAVNADYLLEVASATLSAGVCGTFGAYADAGVAESAAATSYPYTGVSGTCYEFRYTVKDAVGNVTAYTGASITKVDTTCALPWGGSIASGAGTTAYASASVVCTAACVSETRTCTEGTLSGSYSNSACTRPGCVFSATISATRTAYNIRTAAIGGGWDGTSPLDATITINAGVDVYSTLFATAAIASGTLPAGSHVYIINNGSIWGTGGMGGSAGDGTPDGSAGGDGGDAISSTSPLTITNNGTLAGGGGGGGGTTSYNESEYWGSGGGGGTYGHTSGYPSSDGQAGGLPGAPGVDAPSIDGGGGGGGVGAWGGTGGGYGSGGSGYAARAVSAITWLATGTRYGPSW